MQLGTRWSVGEEPPARLSDAVRAAVRAVEAEVQWFDTSTGRWPLTWLDGRPVVELDDGTVIRVGHDGTVMTETPGNAP